MFCFVFKRFCLKFKVAHLHESISYVILCLTVCSICYLHVYCACDFVCVDDCTQYSVFVFVFVFRLHNKGKYAFTKILLLVKGTKECNI